MTIWYYAASAPAPAEVDGFKYVEGPLVLENGRRYSQDVWLQVEPGDGDVHVQLLKSDGTTWYTPDGNILTIEDAYSIKRRNAPRIRIIATGSARFAFGRLEA